MTGPRPIRLIIALLPRERPNHLRGYNGIRLDNWLAVYKVPQMGPKSAPWLQGRVLSGAPDALCLAFVNTVAWRKAESPEDRLPSPFELLDWCTGAGLCEADYAGELRRRWTER